MVGFDTIRVDSPYNIKIIEDLKIEQKLNEHGKLYLKGIVEESDEVNATINSTLSDEIHIYELGEKRNKTLFKGMVASIKNTNIDGVYYIEIEGIAATFLMDSEKKSSSFQDVNMEYPALIKAIIKDYPGKDFINTVGDGVKIENPIFQYGETDWQLIKRLASYFNSVVVSDIMENKPRFYFGMPEGRYYTLEDNISYTAVKDLKAHKKAADSNEELQHTDFFYYEIECGDQYNIGDGITFRKKQLYVSEKTAYMEKGLLKYKYRLSRPKGIYQSEIYNKKLRGLSLEGKVLEVQGELVKLHLNIDTEQTTSKAQWFPFAPPTGNVMYCMPKVGTDANLYFPDDTGKNAVVTDCVRKNGVSCAKTGNPDMRYWGNENGSELEITPGAISITGASKDPLKVTFDDALGLTMTSHKKIQFRADGEISFRTPKRITISGQSQIFVKKSSVESGLSIENNYNLVGNTFFANGSDKTTYQAHNDEPQNQSSSNKKEDNSSSKEQNLKNDNNQGKNQEDPKKSFDWGLLSGNALSGIAVVGTITLGLLTIGNCFGKSKGLMKSSAIGAALFGSMAVGIMAVSDIIKKEVSSRTDYIVNAAKQSFVGALTEAIFFPLKVADAFGLSINPMTTKAIISQYAKKLYIGGMSNFTVYTFDKLINNQKANIGEGIEAFVQGIEFAGYSEIAQNAPRVAKSIFSKVKGENKVIGEIEGKSNKIEDDQNNESKVEDENYNDNNEENKFNEENGNKEKEEERKEEERKEEERKEEERKEEERKEEERKEEERKEEERKEEERKEEERKEEERKEEERKEEERKEEERKEEERKEEERKEEERREEERKEEERREKEEEIGGGKGVDDAKGVSNPDNINIKEVTPPGAKNSVQVYTDGYAQVNKGKIEVYIRGKIKKPSNYDELKARAKELEKLKKANPSEFTKEMQKELKACTDPVHNYDRSKGMGELLDDAGIADTVENNEKIGKTILDSAKEVTSKNTKIRSTINIGNKPVIVESWWIIDKNGTPYCSTIILIEVK